MWEPRRLPGLQLPGAAAVGVDRRIANLDLEILAGVDDVHRRDAVDDGGVAVDADFPVRLARHDRHVIDGSARHALDELLFALEQRAAVRIGEVVRQQLLERRAVSLDHRREAILLGLKHLLFRLAHLR